MSEFLRTGALRLPQSPRAAVFRKIVDQLRESTVLKPVVKTWRAWEGKQEDRLPLAAANAPGVVLTPIGEETAFYAPDSFLSRLTIQVELAVPTLHADDAENLFWAVVRALYPEERADRLVLQQARRDVGAETGLIEFSGLSYDAGDLAVAAPILTVAFTMAISVRLTRNP